MKFARNTTFLANKICQKYISYIADIIINIFRNMDFTDIIKFFNEMAERHDEVEILITAREMVNQMKQIAIDSQ